jgi:ketosteroid isomerase-like protein
MKREIRPWLTRSLLSALAVVLVVAPGVARAGAGNGGSGGGEGDRMVAEALHLAQTMKQFWNERKLDEFVAQYADDAVMVPPNHEPMQGRAAIGGYLRSVRDSLGEMEGGTETFRASASGKLVSLVGKYSFYSGRLRITTHELYERQPDGSLKLAVDMFGLRDPQK